MGNSRQSDHGMVRRIALAACILAALAAVLVLTSNKHRARTETGRTPRAADPGQEAVQGLSNSNTQTP